MIGDTNADDAAASLMHATAALRMFVAKICEPEYCSIGADGASIAAAQGACASKPQLSGVQVADG